MQLWAGLECTVNRVGANYFDQVKRTGHEERLSDIARIAKLGVKKLRYPVLWERTAPNGHSDWSWSDSRLLELMRCGVEPIIGLLHHGSGPQHTSLVDPAFPQKFSAYAREVAERYPWVRDYTPVNEPLTTARFSGLYGHWHPHGRSDSVFAAVLVVQCRGIIEAMRQIRQVNPSARLIQTEDLGKTFSTPRLQYQADFDNERRWLSFDLLAGRVDRHHPMWRYLIDAGTPERDLRWFLENSCPPDVIGINYYVTSDRYLDERVDLFPQHCHGGNGRDRYADIEAIRVDTEHGWGPELRLAEAWNRYRIPLAVTEAHLGSDCEKSRKEWFCEMWEAAEGARSRGAHVIAVTAWSLFGAFDWNCLVTSDRGHYEAGVFDIRHSPPRPSELAMLLQDFSRHGSRPSKEPHSHRWWRSPGRVLYCLSAWQKTTSPVLTESRTA